MSAHLSHKIPWESLVQLYAVCREARLANSYHRPTSGEQKKLRHVARVFARVLQDFERTHQTTDEELRDFDPKVWGEYEWCMGFTVIGYYPSLVWGYIELNLLLTDPVRIRPLMLPEGRPSWAMYVLLGICDNSHPPELAGLLEPAFEVSGDYYLKPLTPDVLDILREHAARLFRCMYTMSGENKLLKEDTCVSLFFGFLEWHATIDNEDTNA